MIIFTLLWWLFHEHIPLPSKLYHYATPIVIFFSIYMAVANFNKQKQLDREMKSFQMTQTLFSKEFSENFEVINNYRGFINDNIDHIPCREKRSIKYCLNHLEIICTGIKLKEYDEFVIKSLTHLPACKLLDNTKKYILAVRNDKSKPDAYRHLTDVVSMWVHEKILYTNDLEVKKKLELLISDIDTYKNHTPPLWYKVLRLFFFIKNFNRGRCKP
ncbi:DUF4760 domain-containing protein, partial [Piscirickettsia litoralis]|uniref:DUF4760 domain-containing protein n=1 Tax=Piscirickettsia litoralis TaxID=1891921 RepID=UPI001F3788C9